jgi:hypothetical protein
MRALLLGLAISASSVGAGCVGHASSGPAWPKPHASEDDGGESLEPRVGGAFVEATRPADNDDHPAAAEPAVKPAAVAPVASAPAVVAPAPSGELQVLEGDEIIIEVDE